MGSLGYRILLPDGGELGFATDLGCYTAAVEEGLRGCGTVMLESNYDDGMILASDYPLLFKKKNPVEQRASVQQRLFGSAAAAGSQRDQTVCAGTFEPEQQYGIASASGIRAGAAAIGSVAAGFHLAGGTAQPAKHTDHFIN